jgi:hypothetical protein
MSDTQILTQLLNGNHLNKKEIERAKQLTNRINAEIKTRII